MFLDHSCFAAVIGVVFFCLLFFPVLISLKLCFPLVLTLTHEMNLGRNKLFFKVAKKMFSLLIDHYIHACTSVKCPYAYNSFSTLRMKWSI